MNAQEKERREEARFLAQPATPKSERIRASYGSLLMSTQTIPGLCSRGAKCLKKEDHAGCCYPED